MEGRHVTFALIIAGSIWLPAPVATHAASQGASQGNRARQVTLREMDRDNDGVITRTEWRGSAQAFRTRDTNHDGVLSGDEVSQDQDRDRGSNPEAEFNREDRDNDGMLSRAEWGGDRATFDRLDRNNDGFLGLSEFLDDEGQIRPAWARQGSFAALDRNGNGVITRSEWDRTTDEFRALDVDADGVLTESEFRNSRPVTESRAYAAGRERGLADGRQAGREDRTVNGGRWDLEGQRELEQADAGYTPAAGSRVDYQAGYRSGFRTGYRDGFGPR